MSILKLSDKRNTPTINLGRLVPGSLIQLLDVQTIKGVEFNPGFYLWTNPAKDASTYWFLISVKEGSTPYRINMNGPYPIIRGIDHGVLNVQA